MRKNRSPQAPIWIGIGIAFYAFIAIGIAEAGLGVLLPAIILTYQLTPATVTGIFISQIGGYFVAAFTSSLMIKRLGLAPMLLIAAIMLTIALIIYGLSPYWLIMVAMGPQLGLSIGLIDAGINTYIVQDERSSNLIGFLHAFYGIGAFLGPAIATTLLEIGMNWREIYLVLAVIVSLLSFGVLGAIIYRYRPMTIRGTSSHSNAVADLKRSLKNPIVIFSGLLLLIYVGIESSIGNWAYGVQITRETPKVVAGYSVSTYWLGLTLGRFTLGYCLQRFGGVKTITLSLILLLTGLIAWWQQPQQLLTLPLIGLSLGSIFPATIWLIPQRLPTALVPAAISFGTSAASLGAGIIPSGLGWVASWTSLEIIPILMLPLALLMVSIHYLLVQYSEEKLF